MNRVLPHNVLLLSNSPKIGGGNRSLLLLHQGLKSRGVAGSVVVPEEGPMAQACLAESVPYNLHEIDSPSWQRPDRAWLSARRWSRILQQSNADIIHANDTTTARSVAIAAWRADVPVVCHIRFPLGPEAIAWTFKRLPKPTAFIFNSHALKAECGPHFEQACPESKQYVVHNAVNLEQFYPSPKQSRKYRVGILANLIPIKGHIDFLQMARLILKQGCEMEFSLIGEDIHNTGYRSELEQIATDLGLSKSVQFLGHRNDIPELLAELDLLVCPSHVEPFGRCLIEAMACEKPVVATRVGGIPEVVDDGVTGLLVPASSPHSLAEAVLRIHSDSELANAMGKAGRKRVEKLFTPEAHAEAIHQVYDAALTVTDKRKSPKLATTVLED
ncbi:glycosyltransferase family 4 protein [Thalassoglobus polymorphus]|uniref:Capsular glucan synthase n=1 Tax=Thalassoglobus polymorphus TaxID=2527994 RepID=A0A517QSQ2_9PLAN|nr:glycosyltransferase family 4 protein [Thalassoglobus polymorphus]QDT34643.1 Capsular glucan synthase [Thalassoglobus polymorphus]